MFYRILYLSFFCFVFYQNCEALNENDAGVCVVKISLPRTRVKYFTLLSNKKCGKNRCVVKKAKKETYTVTSNQTVCCNGWEYDSTVDTCTPLCSAGCSGGRCSAPDICTCDLPALPHPDLNNTCIPCEETCIHAQCINNTCICHDGHHKLNETHCIPNCENGYKIDENLNCKPHCDSCTNSTCTGPNTCTCIDGHEPQDQYTCVPKCDSTCENGTCIDVNTCACKEGYKPIDSSRCEPVCDSCDDVCVAPGVCECYGGFVKEDGACRPFCEGGCHNGVCAAPDECSCDEGYVKNATNPNVCYRTCGTCNGTCVNGTCEGDCSIVTFQSLPTTVTQKRRVCPRNKKCYIKIEKIRKKVPVPTCCNKWEYVESIAGCRPQCQHGCFNGVCTAPDTCTCDPSLVLASNNTCVERPATISCDPPCHNADCTSNNTCTCLNNTHQLNSTHCIPNCDEGYANNPATFQCEPKCEIPCTYGACVAPNVCECYEGYSQQDGTCKPVCGGNCTNGWCSAPNECTCKDGYELGNNDRFKCEPKCDIPCTNGTCVGPNRCDCFESFEPAGPNVCKPKCNSCVHGKCVAPNVCECDEGYSEHDGICKPVCGGNCTNGWCTAPNECTCKDGYELDKKDRFSCIPKCDPDCENAKCTDVNTCTCLEGFEPSDESWVCKPKCRNCQNGVCVAPAVCECLEGYQMEEDTCTPKCDVEEFGHLCLYRV